MTLLASKQLDRQFVGSCRYTSSISFTLDPTESPFAIPILWSMVKHSEYELTEVYSDSTTNLLNDFFRQVCVGEIRIATSGRRFHGATGVGSITPGLIHLCRRDLCLALEQNWVPEGGTFQPWQNKIVLLPTAKHSIQFKSCSSVIMHIAFVLRISAANHIRFSIQRLNALQLYASYEYRRDLVEAAKSAGMLDFSKPLTKSQAADQVRCMTNA